MVFADGKGQVYDHPYFRMVGFSGSRPVIPTVEDLVSVPEFSKLFFIPDCPPIGLDPVTAIRMATLNTAEYFGLKKLGAISPGYVADIAVFDSLKKFNVSMTFKRGKLVAKDGEMMPGTISGPKKGMCGSRKLMYSINGSSRCRRIKSQAFSSRNFGLQCSIGRRAANPRLNLPFLSG